MSDLLEFVLECVLDILCSVLDFETAWRFFLPVLSALAGVALIHRCVTNSGAQLVLSAPVVLAGVATGILWQARRGTNW